MDPQLALYYQTKKAQEEEALFTKQQKLREVWIEITRQMEALKEHRKCVEEQYRKECEIERAQIAACRYAQELETTDEEELAEAIKQADEAHLAYTKQVFHNEKAQEVAQCQIYRIEDRLAHNKKSHRQRRIEAIEARKIAKNYAQEVFDKAQLAISIGQGKLYPERGRYSIPRTARLDDY
jgi:hypothetical protein